MFIIRAAGGGPLAVGLLMGWGVINGMMLGPFISYAISEEGPGIVIQALTGTTAVMLVTGIVAMATGIDFSFLGPILLIALLGLIVVGLVGMFVRFSRTVNLVYSVIGMVVFSGFFLLNFFRLSKSENTWEQAVSTTISLYITFANFFTYLLQFLMSSKRR
jgi:FtsH-binding integral membrane protein